MAGSYGPFNILGTADLLRAIYEGNRTVIGAAPGLQGAAYFIPTVLVPLLLVTHVLVFILLLRNDRHAPALDDEQVEARR